MTPAEHAATVREAVPHYLEGVGVLIPDGETKHTEDCPGCKVRPALDALQAQAEAADTYKADRDEYDALLGRKMAERDRLAARVGELEAALDEIEGSPEHPLEVQAIARAALDKEKT